MSLRVTCGFDLLRHWEVTCYLETAVINSYIKFNNIYIATIFFSVLKKIVFGADSDRNGHLATPESPKMPQVLGSTVHVVVTGTAYSGLTSLSAACRGNDM